VPQRADDSDPQLDLTRLGFRSYIRVNPRRVAPAAQGPARRLTCG